MIVILFLPRNFFYIRYEQRVRIDDQMSGEIVIRKVVRQGCL